MTEFDTIEREACGCMVEKGSGLTLAFCNEHDLLSDYRREFQRGMQLLTAPGLVQNGRGS